MAHRFLLVATVSFVCVNGSWSSAAPNGGSSDGDRRAQWNANPATTTAASLSTPYGSRMHSTAHAYDFWQESESSSFDTRTADAICADLNGDDCPELVRLGIEYGNPYGGTLGITLGGAYGIQGPEVSLQSLPSPKCVRAVDLNADGLIDLIAAHLEPVPNSPNLFTRSATLFIQTGTGASRSIDFLSPAPKFDLSPGAELLLVCDVDQDQVADLVSVGTAHELYYQKGLGLTAGTPAVPLFQAQAISISRLAAQTAGLPPGSSFSFGFANDLVSGDFDGDGSLDIAVAAGSTLGGGVQLFFHRPAGWVYQGLGVSGAGGAPNVTVSSLARGDFNGDGLDDLVATSPNRDLTTLLNKGWIALPPGPAASIGMLALSSPGVGRNSIHAVSADFDGDGLADVACFDLTHQKVVVAINSATSSIPGVFSDSKAFLNSYDMRGSGPRALDAVDIDADGDVDLVGSYLFSQSSAVLVNERLANARKPMSTLRLRGAPSTGALSDSFLPDGVEFEQSPNAASTSNVAADRFSFHASAAAGEELRLRVRLRASGPAVVAHFGLFDPASNRVRWVRAESIDSKQREIVFLVPDAARFVSSEQRVELFVLSSGASTNFSTAIDQISVEVRSQVPTHPAF